MENRINIQFFSKDQKLIHYLSDLTKFLNLELKQEINNKQQIAEIILDIIIGSRNIRQGKAPEFENSHKS